MNSQSSFCCLFLMQFYTFLLTTLVTLSLLRLFIAFFTNGVIDGTPGTLVATFVTFGKLEGNLYVMSMLISCLYPFLFFLLLSFDYFSFELIICIEYYGLPGYAHIVGIRQHHHH